MFNGKKFTFDKAATGSQPFVLPARIVIALFISLLAAFTVGCGDYADQADSTREATDSSMASVKTLTEALPTAEVIFHSSSGDSVLKVEVARSEGEKSRGLMNRSSLDPDSGMIFIWEKQVNTPFWMKNTLIPLSIAFIDESGTIIDIQEMEAETLTLHSPGKPYLYAVEANQGYFARRGINSGDKAEMVS